MIEQTMPRKLELRISRSQVRAWTAELPMWLFTLWAIAMVTRVHLPYMALPSEQSVDEGYLIAAGQRLLHGRMLPYVDGVSHSGPFFMFCGAVLAAIDPFSWLPVRVAAWLTFAAVSALCFACGRRAGRPVAGAVAAAGVPFYASLRMAVHDAIPFNAELPAIACALVCLYAALRSVLESRPKVSPVWLVLSGTFFSLCALSKQVAVLLVVPHAVYVVCALFARDELSPSERVRLLCLYAGAAAFPALVLLLHLMVAGALRDAYTYLVTYNSQIYMYPFKDASRWRAYRQWFAAHPAELGISATALGWGIAQLVIARSREGTLSRAIHRNGFEFIAMLMAVGGVIGEKASMRDMGHYEMLIIPGFSLLAGSLVERALHTLGATDSLRASVASRALLLAPMVVVGEAAWSIKSKHLPAWSTQHMAVMDLVTAHQTPPVCAFIQANSSPTEPIFVWGFRPQLHVSCARLPASRFVFSTFIAGYVPAVDYPKEVEDTLAVPGTRELLLQELEASQPPIIVDSARTMAMRSFRRYEVLFGYVSTHYYMAGVYGGDEVWVRNDRRQSRR